MRRRVMTSHATRWPRFYAPGPKVADRFVIERIAGSGGAGTVYRALDASTGEAVALQVIHRDIKPANLLFVHSDPSQVKVLDFGSPVPAPPPTPSRAPAP